MDELGRQPSAIEMIISGAKAEVAEVLAATEGHEIDLRGRLLPSPASYAEIVQRIERLGRSFDQELRLLQSHIGVRLPLLRTPLSHTADREAE